MNNLKKHSKFKNTGILFELLVRQVTSDMMSNQDSKAVKIIKKFFTGTELIKEYNLYSALIKSIKLSEGKAESLISVILEEAKKLDVDILNKEKYNLIKEIKKTYDVDDFFKAKIKHYKPLAAIYMLFEATRTNVLIDPQQLVENKITLLEYITQEKLLNKVQEKDTVTEFIKEDKDIRLLAYRLIVEKYNEEYRELSTEQKNILKEYINNVSDTRRLKQYINEKFEEVRQSLSKILPTVKDKVLEIKLKEVISLAKPINERQTIKDEHLISLLQYFELIKELKEKTSKTGRELQEV